MFYGAGIIIKKKDHIDTSAVARFDQICFAPGVLSYEKCWNERKVWLSGLLMSSEIIRIVIWIFKPFVNILKNTYVLEQLMVLLISQKVSSAFKILPNILYIRLKSMLKKLKHCANFQNKVRQFNFPLTVNNISVITLSYC